MVVFAIVTANGVSVPIPSDFSSNLIRLSNSPRINWWYHICMFLTKNQAPLWKKSPKYSRYSSKKKVFRQAWYQGAGLSDFQEHVMKRGGMDSYTFIRRKAALSSHAWRPRRSCPMQINTTLIHVSRNTIGGRNSQFLHDSMQDKIAYNAIFYIGMSADILRTYQLIIS